MMLHSNTVFTCLKQLACLRLNALGTIHEHDRIVGSSQRAVPVAVQQ